MKTVTLLIHEDVVLSTVAGAIDMFVHTNRHIQHTHVSPLFRILLVGERPCNDLLQISEQFVTYKSFMDIKVATDLTVAPNPADSPDHPGARSIAAAGEPVLHRAEAPIIDLATGSDISPSDLIIVPAFYGSPDHILKKHRLLIAWMKAMYQQGAEVASLCSGSYFLAEAGLLDGKTCTSHWMDIDDLRRRYPNVNFFSDRVLTDQDGIYTSGGSFSSLNLILYLLEKFCGRELGVWASKMFSLDIDRASQSHFAIFRGQRYHNDEEILRAQTFIEECYQQEISVDHVAEHANMSRRNLIRRFKNATQNTPLEYMQRVKIEAAKKALEKSEESISSLMYTAGYNDSKTFRKVFKRITGLTPQDYRRKYCRIP